MLGKRSECVLILVKLLYIAFQNLWKLLLQVTNSRGFLPSFSLSFLSFSFFLHLCCPFKKIKICLKDKGRDRFSMCGFIVNMATTTRAGPGESQESKAPFGLPCGVTWSKDSGCPLLLSEHISRELDQKQCNSEWN